MKLTWLALAFAEARLEVAWVPLPTSVPADAAAERRCLQALPQAHELLLRELDEDRKVLVHCVAGRDRTCMILAFYLARSSGLAAEVAIAQVRRVRPEALSAPGWEAMATRVITQLLAAT